MSDEPEELDFEERRKRLEQLFAAEPNLSPTMRARQIDAPPPVSNGHHAIASDAPVHEFNGTAESVEAAQPVLRAATDPGARTDGLMNLAAARAEIRRRSSASDPDVERETDGLDMFKDDVLARWRRDIFSDR